MIEDPGNSEAQDPSERILACLPGFAQAVEGAQNALPEILRLPRRQRAREAYRWYMLLAEETKRFLKELFKKGVNDGYANRYAPYELSRGNGR